MVYYKELFSRIKDFLRYNPYELSGLAVGVLITGFIFSFCDWGITSGQCSSGDVVALVGLQNLFLVFIIATISFFFRTVCQKIYALNEGYKAEFKPWWLGMGISLIVGLISSSFIYLPLILFGNMSVAFMVRQRLGEFRHAFSYWHNAMIAYWGMLGNLIMAVLFSIGAYFSPESYFFTKGVTLNLIMAACSLIPLPQLDGLNIFFGSRKVYVLGILLLVLAAVLLLTKSGLGLVIAIIFGLLYGLVYIIIGSEK